MSLTRLRDRFWLAGGIAVLLVVVLIALVTIERSAYTNSLRSVDAWHDAALTARELSLYTQYNAHDLNAYALGHLEHRDEFDEHAAAFHERLDTLQQAFAAGDLDADTGQDLDAVRALRTAYTDAAAQLFVAADAQRVEPSADHQTLLNATWETADQLGDELDTTSSEMADDFLGDAERLQAELEARGRLMIVLVVIAGVLAIVLLLVTQALSARAVGQPVARLLEAVHKFTAGSLDARVVITSRDEIGTLADAFNTLATTIETQTNQLATETIQAKQARQEAEEARAAVVEQLATIEGQQEVIREMSVPVLPVDTETLVLPLVGALDSSRLLLLQDRALEAIEQVRARTLIIDITGVPVVDSQVAAGVIALVQSTRLLGAEAVLVGVRPEVAQSLVQLGLALKEMITKSSLGEGIAFAQRQRRSIMNN